MGVLGRCPNDESVAGQRTPLTFGATIAPMAGRTTVRARCRDNESAAGRTAVLACWRDDELAAGWTMVLTRGRNNGVWGRADDGALALAAISCSLVR